MADAMGNVLNSLSLQIGDHPTGKRTILATFSTKCLFDSSLQSLGYLLGVMNKVGRVIVVRE